MFNNPVLSHPLLQIHTRRISDVIAIFLCYLFISLLLLVCFPEAGPLLQSLFDGDFEAVLLSPQVLDLLGGGDGSDGESIDAYLERRVLAYLNDSTQEDKADR